MELYFGKRNSVNLYGVSLTIGAESNLSELSASFDTWIWNFVYVSWEEISLYLLRCAMFSTQSDISICMVVT
jgi:hypothetical protein